MNDRERTQTRREVDPNRLNARRNALARESQGLRVATLGAAEHAAELCAAATRTVADSRALRGRVFRVSLPRDPTCGSIARRFLEDFLREYPDDVVTDAKTVASELINNAYRHGQGAIELKVERDPRYVRLDVADEGPTGSVRVQHSRGRYGLGLVDALSRCWGAYAGSTHVWAELATDQDEPARVTPLRISDGTGRSAQGESAAFA